MTTEIEAPESDLPQEYTDVLDSIGEDESPDVVDEGESVEPETTETTETASVEESAGGGNEESVPETGVEESARKPSAWNELQKEAKSLNINSKGMKQSELQAAVDSHKESVARFDSLKERAKRDYGATDEILATYDNADALEQRMLDMDRQAMNRRVEQIRGNPEPTPEPQVEPQDEYAEIEEAYGADDPLVQRLKQRDQQYRELNEKFGQFETFQQQQQQMQQQQAVAAEGNAVFEALEKLDMPELFGTRESATALQTQAAKMVWDSARQLAENVKGSGRSLESVVHSAARLLFEDDIKAITARRTAGAAIDQSNTRLGGTGTVSPQTHSGWDGDDIAMDPELHAIFDGFQKDNGSR